MLQWGRNFFVTEIMRIKPELQDHHDIEELQWGRNFFVTEMDECQSRSPNAHHDHASMGP